MHRPLTLGKRHFPINIIQGPLAGISSAPFRLIATRYGRPAFTCTEMISCKTLVYNTKKTISSFLKKLPGEGPLCVQLSGTCPVELGEAVKIATDYGADLIDLNCGCPVKKVRRRGAGSSHLSSPSRLYDLITAMKNNTELPISVKIRVDGLSCDQFNQPVMQAIRDASPDFIIVHGRNWRDGYDIPCHHEQIQFFVEALDIPVIGNGDISCQQTLTTMLSTGCAGVMVARASVGQPWLLHDLTGATRPTQKEIGRIFIEHVDLLSAFLNNEKSALRQARSFCKYYARFLSDSAPFCNAVLGCDSLKALGTVVEHFFTYDKK